MANVKRNKNGYYSKTLTIGHRVNDAGNLILVRKRFYGKTLRELNQKIDQFKENQHNGIEHRTQAFGIMCDQWIETFFLNDGSLKDSTKRLYISEWNRTIKPLPLYSERLDQISARKLQAAYNDLLKSGTPASVLRTCHKLARRFFKYVEHEGFGRDITGSVSLPSRKQDRNTSDIVTWTDEEIKQIFDGFNLADDRFRLRFLIVLAYFTGMRKGELLALRYDDIEIKDDGTVLIHVNGTLSEITETMTDGKLITRTAVTAPKSASSIRTIPVDPCIINELHIHKEWHMEEQLCNRYRTPYIFVTSSGGFYNRKNIDRALNRYYRQIGVTTEKSLHCFRHTFATNLVRSGVPIQIASAMLGHSDISVTSKYYVSVSESEKLAAAMTLRRVLGA